MPPSRHPNPRAFPHASRLAARLAERRTHEIDEVLIESVTRLPMDRVSMPDTG